MVADGRIPSRRAVLKGASLYGGFLCGGLCLGLGGGAGLMAGAGGARPAYGRQPPVGYVFASLGHAGLTGPDGTRAAHNNMPISAGDQIVTGETGRITLRFEGSVVLTAGGATDLTVMAHDATPSGWRGDVRVRAGVLRLEIAAGAPVDRFVIRTPTARIETRDAFALVDATASLTSVYVDRGRVLVGGAEPPDHAAVTVLGAGHGVDILRRHAAYDPLPWASSRVQAVMQRTLYP